MGIGESFTERPLSAIRKMIGARTTETVRTIPHFRLRTDIELDALIVERAERRRARPESRLSVNDVLVKACASALIDTPALNIQYVEGRLRQMQSIDIAVVVALQDGLSTPIVRCCEHKSVWEIASELRSLIERARRNDLKSNEVFGGSFSISNLGMFKLPEFDAIINPPQCAILAVGAARRTVLPGTGTAVRTALVMRVTLSCDHRAVDGAAGARFLSALKERIETPQRLFETPA